MLDTAPSNIVDFAPAEPDIHATAARIRDIILAKAADGEPTTEDDLAEFTLAEVKAHFPAARAAANRIVVRQVEDGRGFETRSQLLTRATARLLRQIPASEAMRQALADLGLHTAEIDDLWPDLLTTLADAFLRREGLVN